MFKDKDGYKIYNSFRNDLILLAAGSLGIIIPFKPYIVG